MPRYIDEIKASVSKALEVGDDTPVGVTEPPDEGLGDFAIACFPFARILRDNPAKIATDLANRLRDDPLFGSAEASGPYVNVTVDRPAFVESVVGAVRTSGDRFGSGASGTDQTALIEHTSINPNSSPHVGRARNALIGDCLVRLLRFEGYEVDVRFFVNDIGKQIAMLVLGAEEMQEVVFGALLDVYVEINRRAAEDEGIERRVFDLLKRLEDGDEAARKQFRRVVDICVDGMREIFARIDIDYHRFDYESDYLFNGRLGEVLAELERTGKLFEDEEGRLVLNQEGHDLAMRSPVLVLTRGDKTSLYALRDVAYSIDKARSGVDRNIIVLGEEQKLYFQQLAVTLELLGHQPPEVVHYSYVNLPEGKMSTRKGTLVLLEDFLDEAVAKARAEIQRRHDTVEESTARAIGIGAVKYAILKTANEKNVIFSWEQALSFEGDAGPYVQYSYARIASVLRRHGRTLPPAADFSEVTSPAELGLAREIDAFTDAISRALKERSPHVIATYAYGLAKRFSTFYHECPILQAEGALRDARLLIAAASAQTLKNALALLGIEVLEEM